MVIAVLYNTLKFNVLYIILRKMTKKSTKTCVWTEFLYHKLMKSNSFDMKPVPFIPGEGFELGHARTDFPACD